MSTLKFLIVLALAATASSALATEYHAVLTFDYSPNTKDQVKYDGKDVFAAQSPEIILKNDNKKSVKTLEEAIKIAEKMIGTSYNGAVEIHTCHALPGGSFPSQCTQTVNESKIVGLQIFKFHKKGQSIVSKPICKVGEMPKEKKDCSVLSQAKKGDGAASAAQ